MSKMQRKWIEDEAVGPRQLDLDFPLATRCTTEPPDGQIPIGTVTLWLNESTNRLEIKAKLSDGRIFTGDVRLRRQL
jgi:hypothetical protein